tara:strand:- start:100 stop:384 length:285 start_codon:yes stop_codon:yes gene_type:complete
MIINILIVFFGYLIGLYLLKSLNPIIEPAVPKRTSVVSKKNPAAPTSDNAFLAEKVKELEETQNNNLVTIQGLVEDIEDLKEQQTGINFMESED